MLINTLSAHKKKNLLSIIDVFEVWQHFLYQETTFL